MTNQTKQDPPDKILRTEEDLKILLDEQVRFLINSADAYDRGESIEAKRLAATIRLLVHDTRTSSSLLGQMGLKSLPFFSSAPGIKEGEVLTYHGLTVIEMVGSSVRFIPFLDDAPNPPEFLEFDAWWDQQIFRDEKKRTLTRKSVVLYTANKDGGAHIDSEIEEIYDSLSNASSLGWKVGKGNPKGLNKPELPAIRQIAHEILKTLVPGYKKMPTLRGVVFGGVSIVTGEAA